MKTAKEMCEEIVNKEINWILNYLSNQNGKASFYHNNAYYFLNRSVPGYNLIKKHEETLTNLGYKVDLKLLYSKDVIEKKVIDYIRPKRKFLFINVPEKIVYKTVEETVNI